MSHSALGILSLRRDGSDRALASLLFDNLRNRILDGLWAQGQKLPGTRIIAKDAGVSRWTAVMAIEMLIAEGLVETRKRSGTYVSWSGDRRLAHSDEGAERSGVVAHVPFALGSPALDIFPLHVWRRIQAKQWKNIPLDALHGGPGIGWAALREAIATHVGATRGIKCTPAQVIVTTSAHSGVLLAGEVLCPSGSMVWIEEPGYPSFRSALDAAGLTPVPVAVDAQGLSVADGRRNAPRASMAIVSAAFQFPTGVQLSAARKKMLLEWSAETGSYVIEDDYACEFRLDRLSAAPLAAMSNGGRVIYMNTFGSTIFPSLRLAYLIVPGAIAGRFAEVLSRTERYATVPNQIVLAEFLSSGNFVKHLRHSRETIAERRLTLIHALRDECAEFFDETIVDCGLHLLARFAQRIDDVAIAALLREAGISALPLSSFYARPAFAHRIDDVGTAALLRGAGVPIESSGSFHAQSAASSGLLLGFSGFQPERLREAAKRMASVLAGALGRRARAFTG
jgi:GntR family transcriptional regulator / MocR family aminotransferase